MSGVSIGLGLIGAFYAFAGFIAARSALVSSFLDRAISAIGGTKPSVAETARTYWLLSAAIIVFAGGVALMALLDIAAWLFILSATGQAAYLFYVAPQHFDKDDPPDAIGRRQSTNAFIIYLVATAFVVWARARGSLTPLQEAHPFAFALAAALIIAFLFYVVWTLARQPKSKPLFGHALERQAAESLRIKVMADYHTHPLWSLDDDTYGDFPPEALELSAELTRDLNEWADAFTSSLNADDPAESLWSDEQHAAHAAKARPLAIRLARERPDRIVFVLDPEVGVVEIRPDENAPPEPGEARAD